MPPAHHQGLNPQQLAAVRQTEGPLLVLAGAGTGKTRVVICRIAELLERGATPGQILAVTFTNKAAREMKERVQKLLKGRDLGGMVISTFHSLGLRLLRGHASRNGTPTVEIADEADQAEMTSDALRECGVRRDVVNPRWARFRISLWKNAAIGPDAALEESNDAMEEGAARAFERYEDLLQRRRLVDFDDLILKPLHLMENDAALRAELQQRWQWLLVDEYQDTNACQYRMLRAMAGTRRNLCVVGDDDQSIYGWRGADPSRILSFQKDFPGAKVIALEQNYRSTGAILQAANAVIANNTQRRGKKLWSAAGEGEKPQLYRAEDEKDETDFIASRIGALVRAGQQYEDLAVLFRANVQCRPLEQALRTRQIPYHVVGTRSFFDRREVRDLLCHFRLLRNPVDDAAFLRVINTPARGFGRSSVEKLAEYAAAERTGLLAALRTHGAELSGTAREGGRTFLGLLAELETRSLTGLGAALEYLVDQTAYRHHLKMVTEDARELATRDQVVDEVIQLGREHGTADIGAFLDAIALGDEQRKDDKDDKKRGVTLLTMHGAKGLEYPVVFLVGLEEGLLPHGRTVAEEEDALEDNPGHTSNAIEEERRLFYVGITRARRTLYLSHTLQRTRRGRVIPSKPSRFLEELGDDLIEPVADDRQTPAADDVAKSFAATIRAKLKGPSAT
ncbi:MAG: hypothetical protein EXS14_10300 [Planctomycetes bacterium]|nr:hypothetical protein [Planctomycetota bacterium]